MNAQPGGGQGSVAPLATRALSVSIGGKTICGELSLAFNRGECWAVLGINGSGKTTLLHVLAGVRKAAAGEILLDGAVLARHSRRRIAQRLALLPQDVFDAFDSTVLESALIGRHPHVSRWWQWEDADDEAIALAALAAVDLAGLTARRVSTLSGGERERLAIAAVLTQQPGVFLLDEPTSHLDIHHQLAALELFSGKARDEACTVLVSLHDASLAARFCSHALLLFEGGEVAAGAVGEVLSAESLTRLYRHPMREIGDGGLRLFVPV
jgi:iron complex transport system ATP-binding protein